MLEHESERASMCLRPRERVCAQAQESGSEKWVKVDLEHESLREHEHELEHESEFGRKHTRVNIKVSEWVWVRKYQSEYVHGNTRVSVCVETPKQDYVCEKCQS